MYDVERRLRMEKGLKGEEGRRGGRGGRRCGEGEGWGNESKEVSRFLRFDNV